MPIDLLLRVCSHVTYRCGLAILCTCASLREVVSTASADLISEWRAQAWILAKRPALKIDASCKLSWDAVKRIQLAVEALRERPTAPPPPNGATALSDFTMTFEGVLVLAPEVGPIAVGPVSEHSEDERLVQLISYLDQDAKMNDEYQQCTPPLGKVRSWMGPLSAEACERHPGFAVDGVYFGDPYANEYVGTFTLLRIFVTTPALETVKLYEGHVADVSEVGSGEMGIYFQDPALPYAHADDAGEWQSDYRKFSLLVEGSEIGLSVEELGGEEAFLSYLRGEAIYSN
jgi:hypothetical protein